MHSFEEVIHFAIKNEEKEEAFYRDMATRARTADQREILLDHARQEQDHKKRLELILANNALPDGSRRYPDPDMQLSDYLVVEEQGTGLIGFQESLLLAAKREKQARRLYQELATQSADPELKKTLLFLAEQEDKHANALEQAYDDTLQ